MTQSTAGSDAGRTAAALDDLISQRARAIDVSGIRRVFELGATLSDPINLSIGQPDFPVPDTIKQALGDVRVYATRIPYLPELRSMLLDLEGMILLNQFGDELRTVVTPKLKRTNLEAAITSVTGKPCSLEISEPSLEDVFIALTQDRPARQ